MMLQQLKLHVIENVPVLLQNRAQGINRIRGQEVLFIVMLKHIVYMHA